MNLRDQILTALKTKDKICREEFCPLMDESGRIPQKIYNSKMCEVNKLFQQLVIDGFLFTTKGRESPKVDFVPKFWLRRNIPK